MKENLVFLAKDELERATKAYGPFNSTHEGWAIIREEVIELIQDCDELKKNLDILDTAVRENTYPWDSNPADKLYQYAIHAAEEALQVAAMAERYKLDILSKK